MRTTTDSSLRLLRSSLLLGLALLVTALPGRAQEDKAAEFRNKFANAMNLNSQDEMANLVRQYVDPAVAWVVETAEDIARRPSDPLYARMDALRKAWKTSMKTKFVDEIERYYSLMDPVTKRERGTLRVRYSKKLNEFNANLTGAKDGAIFGPLALEFEGFGASFEELGDAYFASQSYAVVGNCNDVPQRGEGEADLHKACAAFGKAVALRDKIELKDTLYLSVKQRYNALVGLGFAPEGVELSAEAKAAAAAAAPAAPISVGMQFEMLEKVGEFERPSFFGDELYQIWNWIALGKKGSTSAFARAEDGPVIHRVGSADVQLDLDGDGEPDKKLPLTGNFTPIEFTIGHGETQRKAAFISVIGVEKDLYQGFDMNLAPNDENMSIYIAAAGTMVGTLAGTEIQVIDEDMDGVYGGVPRTWGHLGLTAGNFQPELDSVRIDGSKRALPFSEFMKIGDTWYKMVIENFGTEIKAQPTALKTGTLRLKFKGGKPAWVIVQGQAKYERCFFDLVSGGSKGVEVPVGRYSLYYGELRKGKKRQTTKSLILPSKATPNWIVDEGQTVDVELGGPFGFDFEFEDDGESILVKGTSVCVVGTASERYERPWGCVARPEVSYRKAGGRKGSKPEKMAAVQTQNELGELGWQAAWAPRDMRITKKSKDGEVEVRLVEKKNKLFGKIESAWKEE